MKQIKYVNPTNIDNVSNERIRAYFSVLYCEIVHPKTGKSIQRTGLLSETHSIIGAANLLPFGTIDEELEKRWREISKETTDIIDRAKNAPIQDRPIIMDNLISALALFKKMQKNMIDAPDEAVATCYPSGKEIPFNVSGEPKGLKRVKALANEVMGAWKVFFAEAENTHYNTATKILNEEKSELSGRNFRDNIMGSELEKDRLLKILHILIDGHKGKRVALVIWGCVDLGLMHKPSYSQVAKEFAGIGAKSGYNNYANNPNKFADEEKNGIKQNILRCIKA